MKIKKIDNYIKYYKYKNNMVGLYLANFGSLPILVNSF